MDHLSAQMEASAEIDRLSQELADANATIASMEAIVKAAIVLKMAATQPVALANAVTRLCEAVEAFIDGAIGQGMRR